MIHEFHITVDCTNTQNLLSGCSQLSLKPLIIRLSHGKHSEQFMCTTHLATHSWKMANEYREHLVDTLDECGFAVIRSKVEVPIKFTNRWQEFNFWDNEEESLIAYHELHISVDYTKYAEIHMTYLSCNDYRVSHSVLQGKMWVTKRLPPTIDAGQACVAFEDMVATLKKVGIPVIDYHCETAVYDDNSKLDEGWLINTY